MEQGTVRVGLVGYGMAGRQIHAPLIRKAGLEVPLVVTSNPERRRQLAEELPDAEAVNTADDLLARGDEIDVVVLASPSGVHVEQAMAAVDRGLPVVVDKPLATDADAARRVVDHAERAGVPLTVFQNRRWDAEQLTLRALLDEGRLGEVMRFERRWERWRPQPKDRWRENAPAAEGGGTLLDLHSHLVDSAVQLFGPVRRVYAEVAARTTKAEDDAFLSVEHASGVRSHLGAHSLAGAPGPRTRVLGRSGAYVVTNFEQEITAFPGLDDEEGYCGWLVTGESRTPVPRAPGEHADFYRAVAGAVRGEGAMPVNPHDAVHVLSVIDAARRSAAERTVVDVHAVA
jgi:predicted dehydrogenase